MEDQAMYKTKMPELQGKRPEQYRSSFKIYAIALVLLIAIQVLCVCFELFFKS